MQDWQLLQEFVKDDSQVAFGHLVERYLNLVYSTCLREIGDSGLAEDATQAVFLLLWQKAHTLRPGTVLTGWLFQTACFVAKNAKKQEFRRLQRTQKAAEEMMHEAVTHTTEEDKWSQIQPLLHEAMGQLNAGDRDAVLLRCFEGRSLKETGQALGVTEDAARKRVARALDKLRRFFTRQGFTLSVATLASLLAANSVQAAPAGLATAISATFAANAGSVLTSVATTKALTLAETAKRAWMLGKIKAAATAICGVSLVAVGTKQLTEIPIEDTPRTVVNRSRTQPRLTSIALTNPTRTKVKTTAPKSSKVLTEPTLRKIATPSVTQLPKNVGERVVAKRRIEPVIAKNPRIAKALVPLPGAVPDIEKTREVPPDSPQQAVAKQLSAREPIPARDDNRSQEMQIKKTVVTALAGAALMASALAPQTSVAAEGDKGTLTGMLTAKGENWIEVRADDAKESKRYIPNWIGGLPKDGGGPDRAILETIKKLRVPNRVQLNWAFIEHLRVVGVEWFEPKDKTGVVEGEVTAKGENWVEVKSGDKPVERYSPRWSGGLPKDGGSLDKDALHAIAEVKVGDKVRLEWAYEERLRVVSLRKQ